jgi:hypothetical protein
MKLESEDSYIEPTTIRSGTALLVLDLVDHGRLVPMLLVGAGLDRASSDYVSQAGHHFEGGLGLEYRAAGGFTIGVDVRMGGRSVDDARYGATLDSTMIEPSSCSAPEAGCGTDTVGLVGYTPLREGGYRAARLTIGVAF